MPREGALSGSDRLTETLRNLVGEAGFSFAVLTDRQGLPIASAGLADYDPDNQSAVVALVQKAIHQAGAQIGFTAAEVTLHAAEGQKMVCRPFTVNSQEMILAVIVPWRDGVYRRLTNKAIAQVRRIWKEYWEV